MGFESDTRTVMTLDAGGTNFVFSAIRRNEQVVEDILFPPNADNLEKCLKTVVEGFDAVKDSLIDEPAAISFAFPGPADYPKGIIGDLPNLPAFRGGVALGPMLEEKFKLPVFINNDGDLYAYGEAIGGFLPAVNKMLEEAGSPKRYKNLLGLTLGTGFGAGIVRDGNLFLGDNSIAGEIWLIRNKLIPTSNIEDHASIRGVKRIFARESGLKTSDIPEPKDIYEIASGRKEGDKEAAILAFKEMAEAVGDAVANAITLIDGLVVIGGGLSGASEIFMRYLVKEMNSTFLRPDGSEFRRLVANVYNLEENPELQKFLKGSTIELNVPGSNNKIKYDPEMRIGVGISKIGTSKAIMIGAYAYALNALDM